MTNYEKNVKEKRRNLLDELEKIFMEEDNVTLINRNNGELEMFMHHFKKVNDRIKIRSLEETYNLRIEKFQEVVSVFNPATRRSVVLKNNMLSEETIKKLIEKGTI